MSSSHSRLSRGFTLVEMLVVLGIIGVLAALLLPAVMSAITRARNASVMLEVNQISQAVESYKQDKGDYPPTFRDFNVVARHIRQCFPKIDPQHLNTFMRDVFPPDGMTNSPTPLIDEGEALVFWLNMTDTDPRRPFLAFYNATGQSPKKYYPFDETRLLYTSDTDTVPSYRAKFCKDMPYLYVDHRSYVATSRIAGYGNPPDTISTFAYSLDETGTVVGARPYWSETKNPTALSTALRDAFKPTRPTSFQLLCAGLDGEFGDPTMDTDMKFFPSGTNYTSEDKDNITSFSEGKLNDKIP